MINIKKLISIFYFSTPLVLLGMNNNNPVDQRLLRIATIDIHDDMTRYLIFDIKNFKDTFPRLSIISGNPGSGKTTIARGIASRYNYPEQIIECSQLNTTKAINIFDNLLLTKNPHFLILRNLDLCTVPLWPLIDRIEDTNHKVMGTCSSLSNVPLQIKKRTTEIVEIPLPSFKARKCIARCYLDKSGFEQNEGALEIIARNTDSFSGKDIEQLVKRMIKSANKRLADSAFETKTLYTDDILNNLRRFEPKHKTESSLHAYCNSIKDELIDKWPQLIGLIPLIYKLYTTHRLLKSYTD